MEESNIKDFIDTYCSIPPEPKSSIIPVTDEEIIDKFISYIKNTCIDTHTLVKYKMPNEFYGRIDKDKFWEIVIHIVDYVMNFEDYNLGEWKTEPVYNTNYDHLGYRQYFLVSEKKYVEYDDYIEDWIALEIHKIDKIVFRIYKK
jgi:hypothetical protein